MNTYSVIHVLYSIIDNYVLRSCLDFPQSWILPVLKNSVCKAELAYYTSDLLPLAGKMRSSGQEWRTRGRDLEGKLFETLEFQVSGWKMKLIIWNLC